MSWLKQNWMWLGLGVLFLVVIIFTNRWGNNSSNIALIGDTTLATVSPSPTDEVIDTSIFTPIMPVEVGTRWTYEGKRIYYDPTLEKTKEVTVQKTVEITSIKMEGNNLRVFTLVSYKNEPELKDNQGSFLVSALGYFFGETNVAYFPLAKGQRLTSDYTNFTYRTDGYYDYWVTAVNVKNILGKKHTCYDISYHGLPDESLDVFCEGVGYVEDSYKHHGTPDEWDYKLIRIENPSLGLLLAQKTQGGYIDVPWEYSKKPVYLSLVFGGRRTVGRYEFKVQIIEKGIEDGTQYIKVRYTNKFEPFTESEENNDFSVKDNEKEKYSLYHMGEAKFEFGSKLNKFITTDNIPIYSDWWE